MIEDDDVIALFELELTKYQETQNTHERTILTAQEAHTQWQQSWHRLSDLRDRQLRMILDRQNLDICSMSSSYHARQSFPLEKLGLYPKDQIKLIYRSYFGWRGSHYTESLRRTSYLSLLCPMHYPNPLNQIKPSKDDTSEPNIQSEVTNQGGKLITVVNAIDVTDMTIERRYNLDDLYEHFGLPGLPPEPPYQWFRDSN